MASLEGTLLGFVLAALTIVLGYSQSPRFAVIRQSRHWSVLFGIYLSGVRWTALATVFSLTALILDKDRSPNMISAELSAVSLVFSAVFITQVLWATEGVVKVVISERSRAPGE